MSRAAGSVPSSFTVMLTLIGVTWRRLLRGRALWVSVLISFLPVALAGIVGHGMNDGVNLVQFLVLVLLPPMFVASSLGEEIEDRTTTYLWSRPIARWTVVASKLVALTPVAIVLILGGFFMAQQVGGDPPPMGRPMLGLAAGTIAISALASGLATLVPKHGMALSIVYLIVFDLPLGAIPASINNLSITHQVMAMMGEFGTDSLATPAITLAILTAGWLAIAFARIARLES